MFEESYIKPTIKFFKGVAMTIKPPHLLRSFLLIPYLAWGLAFLLADFFSPMSENSTALGAVFNVLAGILSFYVVGIFLWGIPYTLLALGLLVWSVRKPARIIYKTLVFSPFLLALFMIAEVALVSFSPGQAPSLEGMKDFLSQILVVTIPSLAFGYFFVGVCLILYKAITYLISVNYES
jgi:hypothetical protein